MHSSLESNRISDAGAAGGRDPLTAAIASAHARAGRARSLAATILDAAVRLYSTDGEARGWLWRYAW
jgi:hypothetical protein